MLDHVVYGDDRGMIQPGCAAGLPQAPFDSLTLLLGRKLRREDDLFHCHITIEPGITCSPDPPHATTADALHQPVAFLKKREPVHHA